MSREVRLNNVNTGLQSQTANTLSQILAANARAEESATSNALAEKRLKLLSQREAARDARAIEADNRAIARTKLLDKRYNNQIQEAKDEKMSALNGLTEALQVNFDGPMTEDVVNTVESVVPSYSKNANLEIQKAFEKGGRFYNPDSELKNTDADLLLEKEYNKIENDKDLSSNEKELKKIILGKKYGMSGESSSPLKKFAYGVNTGIEGLSRLFSPVVNMFQSDESAVIDDIGRDNFSKRTEKDFGSNPVSRQLSEKLKSIRDTRIRRENAQNAPATQEQLDFIKNKEVMKTIKTKVTTKDVALSPEKFSNQNNKELEKILSSPKVANMSVSGKTAFIQAVMDKLNKRNTIYQNKRDNAIKRANNIEKRKLDLIDSKAESRFKSDNAKDLADYKFLLRKKEKENLSQKEKLEIKVLRKKLKEG